VPGGVVRVMREPDMVMVNGYVRSGNTAAAALVMFRALNADQRAAVMSEFCHGCWSENLPCYCQRDE
jgi:hypothetical protein